MIMLYVYVVCAYSMRVWFLYVYMVCMYMMGVYMVCLCDECV